MNVMVVMATAMIVMMVVVYGDDDNCGGYAYDSDDGDADVGGID